MVSTPAVDMLSLTRTGIPVSGPGSGPDPRNRRSASSAEAMARSEVVFSAAFKFPSISDMRDSVELVSSVDEEYVDNDDIPVRIKRERLEDLASKNAFSTEFSIRESESIALDIKKILSSPGSLDDMILKDGDIISVPEEMNTVRLRGQVLYPNTIRFESVRSAKYYINQSG